MRHSFEPTPPTSQCLPPRWARGAHAQTLLGHLLPVGAPELVAHERGVERTEVEVSGGDRLVALHVPPAQGVERKNAVVVLFHGLTGCANSTYMRRTASAMAAGGYSVVAVNHRGSGAGEGLARDLYHSGCAPDLACALAHIRRRYAGSRVVAVGFSLSGNALLYLLGRERDELPDAAIAVNPPVDLERSVQLIRQGVNRLYDLKFVRGCADQVRSRVRAGLMEREIDVPRFATLQQWDDLVTAPLGGFRDSLDYYERCSAAPWLAEVARPTVVLTSRDDPFIDWRDLQRAERSKLLHLHVEEHGGHLGYLARNEGAFGYRRWMEDALLHFVEQLLEEGSEPVG